MLKYLIIPVILAIGLTLFYSVYCTTPEKQRVFQVFNPLFVIVFFITFLVNGFLIYSFYQLEQLVGINHPLKHVYQFAPYIIVGLALIPLLLQSGNWTFMSGLGFLVWILCFLSFVGTFLFVNGFQILFSFFAPMNGYLFPFVEEMLKIHISQDDIFFQIYTWTILPFIILSLCSIIIFLKNLLSDDNESAISMLLLIIVYCTGLIFPIALLSYIRGELIWE